MSGADESRRERVAADLEAARRRLQEAIPPPDDGAAPAQAPPPGPRRRQGGLVGRARRLLGRGPAAGDRP